MMSAGFITGDINLILGLKVVSARFLHYKVTAFLFVIKKYFLVLCKYMSLTTLLTITIVSV